MSEPGNDTCASAMPRAGDTMPPTEGWQTYEFGAPESVLDRSQIFDMFEVVRGAKWYDPPISTLGLGKAYRMASHHQSAILLKRNLLAASFVPSDALNRFEFSRLALDYLIFGNAYLEAVPNVLGGTARYKTSPAAWTRVGVEPGVHWFIQPGTLDYNAHRFEPGMVTHIMEPDPLQEIYGMPEYISALQSGLLNENATLFRRKYYKNGAHAGFIMHVTDPNMNQMDSDALRKALRGAKGPGNFRNLFLHIPNGKPDGVKIIPIAEVAANDQFLNIKDVTRDDMLSAHRTPPQLLGIVPKNGTGFGNVIDAARAFYHMEIGPIQVRLGELNDMLGRKVISFAEPADMAALLASVPATPAPPAK